ncbi:MAG: SLBB domain-containing protein [Saprospiraceae bacterium]|nr:SLBB domain-containing protein [Saprospiraceae bacterium]
MKSALLVLALSALFIPCSLTGQVSNLSILGQDARERLAALDISEEDLKVRLREKGYDVDNIDPANIDEFTINEYRRVIEETVAEMVAEREAEAEPAEPRDTVPPVPQPSPPEPEPPPVEKMVEQKEPEEEPMIYGQHLFKAQDVKIYSAAEDIKPPPTYILGTGDELSIFINGPSVVNETVRVDRQGYIRLEGTPPIAVRGLTVAAAREMLRQRLKRHFAYRDNQFDMSVQTGRTITVNIYGEVERPGAFTISAVNPLFNALVLAGGPSEIGTVRNIRLIRGDEEKVFDVYRFMQDPGFAEDFYLQENDYIHVGTARRVMEISGSVKRPYKYELKSDEHLIKLIEYAGGLGSDAYLRDIQITRYSNDRRVVINVDLREIMDSGGDFLLSDGDKVLVKRIDDQIENYVELQGAVHNSGRFERKDSMRLSDLIALGEPEPSARLDFAYMLRYNPNGMYSYQRLNPQTALSNPGSAENILLRNRDIVRIQSQVQYSDEVSFTVQGAVRAPGEYNFDPAGVMTVQDAILISGGLKPSASDFGFIVRHFPEDPKTAQYLPFNTVIATNDANSPDNYVLVPNDSMVIFDVNSLTDEFFIQVKGAVRQPGRFRYDANLTLREAIKMAGGLTFSAASNRVDVSRVIIQENQPTRTIDYTLTVDRDLNVQPGDSVISLLPFDEIVVREVPEFELQRYVYLRGEVSYPGAYAIVEENERVASFIRRAGGLTPEAFLGGARLTRSADDVGVVIIDLETALDQTNSTANLVLQHGDTITVPKQQELVSISGAVNLSELYPDGFIQRGNKINVTYEEGKRARYYINKYAAGIAEQGRWRLTTVEHANGRVEKTQNLGLFRIYPKVTKGATINVGRVPEKTQVEKEEKEPVDWSEIVRDSLAQATAILTLILLLERLN